MDETINDGYPNLESLTDGMVWTGNLNEEWTEIENWNLNIVPDYSDNVIIKSTGNDPIVSEPANCNDLSINLGATLTVESGSSLITLGNISNNGTFIKEHSLNNGHWQFFSSPVNDATANIVLGDYLQYFDETLLENNYIDIANEDTPLVPCKGYAWRNNSKTDIAIEGTPNTGNLSISTTAENPYGWNLVGNPYPSSIDWNVLNNKYGTVYTFVNNDINGGYAEYNNGASLNGGTRNLAPMQGFFISTSETGTFAIDNSARTHEGSSGFVKAYDELHNYVKLVAASNEQKDEMFIQLGPQYQPEFEKIYDAWKMDSYNSESIMIFSKCEDGNLSIDRRPETENITLGFKYGKETRASISIMET